MATTLGRIMTYLKQLPLIKLLDSFVMMFGKSRDKVKSLFLHYYSDYDH